MASTKISQLPLQTATTTNDVVAIVDSGNTTTSKIDLQTLFRASGSTINQTSSSQNNLILASSQSTITDTASPGGTGDNAIIASTSATIDKNQGGRAAIIASNEVRVSNDNGEGAMNAIIASYGSTTEVEGGFANTIISSKGGSFIQRGENNTIISGQGPQIYGGGNQVSLATNSWNMSYGYNNLVACSESGTMGNHRYTAVIGNYQFGESDSGNQCFVAAGENTRLESRGGFASWKSMISVKDSTCQDEGASMISASGRSSNYPWTLHSDYTYSYKGEATEWRDGGNVSGSFSVDLSTGSLWSFTIGGNIGTIQLDNTRKGGVYEFWVYNSGSYSITSMNLDGGSGNVFVKSGSINPTNNGYTYYRLRVVDNGAGGLRGILNESLDFQAL